MNMLQALEKYESMQELVERCNRMVLETLGRSNVREARIASESFQNGGKRLRPMLTILSSMAPKGGRDVSDSLIQLAAAVELIHLATLFHDDVIDEVEQRRQRVSARVKYGNYVSVLAGDYALSEALLLAQNSGETATMPEFLRTVRVLVSGESRETAHSFDFDMSEATYFEIISEKSASLFALSCKVGGITTAPEYADVLGHLGWNLGMAFQMIDDLDDMLPLNGSADCDLANGYLALPVLHVLARDGRDGRLVEMIRRGAFSEADQRLIVRLCREHGGIEHTRAAIDRHLQQAAAALDPFEAGDARTMLENVLLDLGEYAAAQVTGFDRVSRARHA
jgi:geranylgeranyl pyrophosphate synthase